MLSPSYCRALCLAASLASLLRTDARTGALLGQAKPEQEQHARRPPPDMPPAWPSQYTAFQVSTYPEFGATQQGYFYYDFDNMRQRVNHVTVVGAVPGVGKNTTEFWLGDQLNIVDWTDRSCQRVNMGFSIPRPTWFQTNSTLAPVTQWLLHAPPAAAAAHSGDDDGYSNPFSTLAQPPSGSRAAVPTYHEVVWLSKEDVFGLPPFNYYALVDTGYPFRLEAPSGQPFGAIVVNEFFDVTPGIEGGEDLFTIPADISCASAASTAGASHLRGN